MQIWLSHHPTACFIGIPVWSKARSRVLIFRQDVTAQQPEDYVTPGVVNMDTPTVYSIAEDIEDFRQADGVFYMEMCFVDLFDECYYFK